MVVYIQFVDRNGAYLFGGDSGHIPRVGEIVTFRNEDRTEENRKTFDICGPVMDVVWCYLGYQRELSCYSLVIRLDVKAERSGGEIPGTESSAGTDFSPAMKDSLDEIYEAMSVP